MEEALWDSANKLRGSVESSEYKHVVLGLIFLKFVSDRFSARREELIAEGKDKYLEMKEFYNMKNIFFLPEEARWSHIIANAKQDDIALKIDTALHTVEKHNPSLKGALPDNYFSRLNLDPSKLSALLDTINNIDTLSDEETDVVGRVYEYFLGKFAASEGKGGGEFYTPKCIVKLLVQMLQPYKGKIYDPACGSGGDVCPVDQLYQEPSRGYQGCLHLWAGTDSYDLQTGQDESRHQRHLWQSRRSPCQYLLQRSAPRSQGGLHHG